MGWTTGDISVRCLHLPRTACSNKCPPPCHHGTIRRGKCHVLLGGVLPMRLGHPHASSRLYETSQIPEMASKIAQAGHPSRRRAQHASKTAQDGPSAALEGLAAAQELPRRPWKAPRRTQSRATPRHWTSGHWKLKCSIPVETCSILSPTSPPSGLLAREGSEIAQKPRRLPQEPPRRPQEAPHTEFGAQARPTLSQ